MGKRVAIIQSNYIPWKGYFDFINLVDEFILFDDVQYTRRDWRNRNRIKTPAGLQWLTIPVEVSGKYFQKIKETKISTPHWNLEHWQTIKQYYARTAHFKEYESFFSNLYRTSNYQYLSEVNFHFITAICNLLGIQTRITWSMDYGVIEGKTERLVDLCKKSGAAIYLSGPAAKDYIDPTLFQKESIGLSYMDYSGYMEYPQLFPPFEHAVSILDLIFCTGADATRYMLSFGKP